MKGNEQAGEDRPPQKILLLNLPRFTDGIPISREECAFGPSFAAPIPNILMNIGAVLKDEAETQLYDAVVENTGFDKVGSVLDEVRPDAVVTTVMNCTLSYEAPIAEMCASRGIRCVAVPLPFGLYPKAAAVGPFWFVMKTEPEKTILDWVQGAPREELGSVAYMAGDELVETGTQKSLFDKLPPMNWPLLSDVGRYGWRLYQISRNCRWNCTFCMWASGAPRFKPVDTVIHDLQYMKRHTRGSIGLLTSSITQRRKWFEEFIEKVAPLKLRFTANIRADETDRDDLLQLKKAGCYSILIGVESFSNRILQKVNKRETVERNIEVIRWCNEIGMTTDATFIMNIGETDEEVDDYIRAVLKCRPTRAIPLVYKHLEGTEPIADEPMIEKTFWGSDPVKTNADLDMAVRRIEKFRKKTRILKIRNIFWHLFHPNQWGALWEHIKARFQVSR